MFLWLLIFVVVLICAFYSLASVFNTSMGTVAIVFFSVLAAIIGLVIFIEIKLERMRNPFKSKKPKPPIQSRVRRNTGSKFELPDRKEYADSADIGTILASKSVLIGGTKYMDIWDIADDIISHIVLNSLPEEAQIIMIEDDKCDTGSYQASILAHRRMLPHVHSYAGTPEEAEREIKALRKDIDRLQGTADDEHFIYIITSLHKKMYAQYKEEFEYWQENGPAAGFKLISLLSKPNKKQMDESTVRGFETRVALRCRTKKQIAFLMQKDFAECKPRKHKALVTRYNSAPYELEIHHRSDRELERLSDFWCKQGRAEWYITELRMKEIQEIINEYREYARTCNDPVLLKESERYRRFVWAGEELKKLEQELAAQEKSFACSTTPRASATKPATVSAPRDEDFEADDYEVDDFDEDLYPELSDIDKPKRKSKGYSIDEMVEMDAIFDDDF